MVSYTGSFSYAEREMSFGTRITITSDSVITCLIVTIGDPWTPRLCHAAPGGSCDKRWQWILH